MLAGCHERVLRSLALLKRLVGHVHEQGIDRDARSAARDVLRYFDIAGPQHHLDEERHVLPLLEGSGDDALIAAARRLRDDHDAFDMQWQTLRVLLLQLRDDEAQRWSPSAQHELAHEARAFIDRYREHLPLEDEVVFPAARRLIAARGAAAIEAMGREMAERRGVQFRESAARESR
jgi:hemerythrin-like domain-containing protein